MKMSKDVVVIAGASQSGTTSLYELLCRSKVVRPGHVKELDFWQKPELEGMPDYEIKRRFESQFPASLSSESLLDASPAYLRYSAFVAPRIKRCFPSAKIIIILREPEARLNAVYRKMRNESRQVRTVSYSEFQEIAISGLWKGSSSSLASEIASRADVGYYEKYLQNFTNLFDVGNFTIIRFEELMSSPKAVLSRLELFLSLPAGSLAVTDLPWTNKNKNINNFVFHKAARSFYKRFEPLLRSHPDIKKVISKVYFTLNSKSIKSIDRRVEKLDRSDQRFYNYDFSKLITDLQPYLL